MANRRDTGYRKPLQTGQNIITTEAYDWQATSPRCNQIRINDSFNEADYYSDGGQTYGHQWYPRGQVADGVLKATTPADRRFLIY